MCVPGREVAQISQFQSWMMPGSVARDSNCPISPSTAVTWNLGVALLNIPVVGATEGKSPESKLDTLEVAHRMNKTTQIDKDLKTSNDTNNKVQL